MSRMKRRIKLICFDLNKTLIKENSWLQLNLAMGVTEEEDQELLGRYEKGQISYEQWQQNLSKIYLERGRATRKNILEALNNYKYLAGAEEIIKYLKSKEYEIALISGSIDLLVERIGNELQINLYEAHNRLNFDKDGKFIEIVCEGDDSDFKLAALRRFCVHLDIDIKHAVVVGDGDNDLKMFEETGLGITFEGSAIEKYAWRVIDRLSDIKMIL